MIFSQLLNFFLFRYTCVCLTKLDILDTLPELKVCIGYRYNGKEIDYFPSTASELAKVEPIYETLEGWNSKTEGVRSIDQLPLNARKYVQLIEDKLNVRGNYRIYLFYKNINIYNLYIVFINFNNTNNI